MLIDIQADRVPRAFGLSGVTYFPSSEGGRLRAETAQFLSTVGLPSNKFFSPKLDLDDPVRLECRPSLKAMFDADGATCPSEAESWEALSEFQYATAKSASACGDDRALIADRTAHAGASPGDVCGPDESA
ncbi:hypothetical protein [Streptomyces sp. NPDC002746]